MKKIVLLIILFSLNVNAQITYVDINPDFSSTIITGVSDSGLSPIVLPGGETISFRWDSFSPSEWFYHVEGTGGVNFILSAISPNPYGKPYANNLISGSVIDASNTYSSSPNNDPIISDSYNGNFSNQGDRYIGFRFLNAGQIFYGWILVNSTGQSLIVKEYAYRNTANTLINAGDKGTLSTKVFVNNDIIVYPNPVNDILKIQFEEEIVKYKVYSILGELIFEVNKNISNEINVSELKQGQYFLKINELEAIPFIKE